LLGARRSRYDLRVSPEDEIRALRESGDLAAAAARTIRAYGPEVLGFLTSLVGAGEADDVFAQASHDLWIGMASFRGQASMRTWFYTLARHAASRHRRTPRRRNVPISEVSELVEKVRTQTAPHLRSDVKDRFATIRESLDPDDRWLLVLRVDRGMSWADIARVMDESGGEPPEADVVRATARLRKRFQLVKQIIRDRARAAGLLPDD
jgi:RNA polymerase sigma-70 factor (ECF subfamily)